MKKLILVQWNVKTGPLNLVQFPPEEEIIPNEFLLKIWAKHEMNSDSNFCSLKEGKKYYCSLLKIHKIENQPYFIILELDENDDVRIFEEILENIAEDLILKVGKPYFSHVLTETYTTIKHYSDLDEFQIFLRLFEDKNRIDILHILRKGVISKPKLEQNLEEQFGYANLNLDLLLTPFIRLGMISVLNDPGSNISFYLTYDAYACRIPPKQSPKVVDLEQKIIKFFSIPQILDDDLLQDIVKLHQQPGVKELNSLLREDVPNGIDYEIALTTVRNDPTILEELERFSFIYIYEEKQVFLFSNLQFVKFNPSYLLHILKKRYESKEISLEQLIHQIEFISK
ncbi:hypothetical protein DSAG12_03114 [Promethearchaeum syntrophicum]|uniref:Uncharacterized protein n=1 Tax=Promethearchaeum syntrophicum TaxID=2594042 RepID=A0A5B9DDW6_9ARCH|nr:hypothetical protein [Candidatus Prometheoarchaeum syntrophicum]QEE17282.1 hypothetical protein DSAG12_03114 [Candidatus Prometheoarchaeum syntrophicum]